MPKLEQSTAIELASVPPASSAISKVKDPDAVQLSEAVTNDAGDKVAAPFASRYTVVAVAESAGAV